MTPEDVDDVSDVLDSPHESVERESRRLFGPFEYSLKGKGFRCSHCGNPLFHKCKAHSNAEFMVVEEVESIQPEVTLLICSECGVILWVNEEPERLT